MNKRQREKRRRENNDIIILEDVVEDAVVLRVLDRFQNIEEDRPFVSVETLSKLEIDPRTPSMTAIMRQSFKGYEKCPWYQEFFSQIVPWSDSKPK